jgi:hypothetical protein
MQRHADLKQKRHLAEAAMKKWVAVVATAGIAAFGFASLTVRAQQIGTGLDVPFATTGTGQSASVAISGDFRITQFIEQGGSAFAAGTLAVAVGDPTAPRTTVTQVVVPLLNISSASSSSSLTLASGSSTVTPGTTVGTATNLFGQAITTTATLGTPMTTNGTGTTASSFNSTPAASSFTLAGAASATAPGVQANCGPIQMQMGPLDETVGGTSFHLDRLVLNIAAPQNLASSVSTLMCSTDAALAQAAGAKSSAATSSFSTGSAIDVLVAGASSPTTLTPLQSLVAALNQMLSGF